MGWRWAVCLWPARGVSTQVSGLPRELARGPENLGSTKRAAQTCSLAPEGRSVQTYPPSQTATSEERGRTAPNHQAGGLLSPKDAALHMTDVALLAWPSKRHPSSINAGPAEKRPDQRSVPNGASRLRRRRLALVRRKSARTSVLYPDLVVLATRRARFALSFQRVLPLTGRGVHPDGPAVQMFRERSRAVGGDLGGSGQESAIAAVDGDCGAYRWRSNSPPAAPPCCHRRHCWPGWDRRSRPICWACWPTDRWTYRPGIGASGRRRCGGGGPGLSDGAAAVARLMIRPQPDRFARVACLSRKRRCISGESIRALR